MVRNLKAGKSKGSALQGNVAYFIKEFRRVISWSCSSKNKELVQSSKLHREESGGRKLGLEADV